MGDNHGDMRELSIRDQRNSLCLKERQARLMFQHYGMKETATKPLTLILPNYLSCLFFFWRNNRPELR